MRRSRIHPHCAVLTPDEVTTIDGIPVTTPTRTLLDLAATLPRRAVEQAVNQAEILNLPVEVAHPGRRGVTRLRQLEPARIRSELERRFLAFLKAAVLPRPQINTYIEGFEAHFAWPDQRLVVELDGYATHRTRHAFETDRARDRHLQARGWRVVRVTWRQLHGQPGALARALRALLG